MTVTRAEAETGRREPGRGGPASLARSKAVTGSWTLGRLAADRVAPKCQRLCRGGLGSGGARAEATLHRRDDAVAGVTLVRVMTQSLTRADVTLSRAGGGGGVPTAFPPPTGGGGRRSRAWRLCPEAAAPSCGARAPGGPADQASRWAPPLAFPWAPHSRPPWRVPAANARLPGPPALAAGPGLCPEGCPWPRKVPTHRRAGAQTRAPGCLPPAGHFCSPKRQETRASA